MRGELHSPYWYSYTRVHGKVKSQYVGKKRPREIKAGAAGAEKA